MPEKEKALRELVAHFKRERESLRKQWVQQMTANGFLAGLTQEEIETESSAIYGTCVSCIETGSFEDVQDYSRKMTERGALSGMTFEQIISGMLTLREVYSRSLFDKYRQDAAALAGTLDAYEPIANRILSLVALAFIEERERVIRRQQEALRELSTPVLQIRDGLLLLPIIGLIDTQRARQLTEQLLKSIRLRRARVVVIDITGVPTVDSKVANHLLQTFEAIRLMGAEGIVTGISAEIAQTIVTIGVDLSKIKTLSELQQGVDEADRLLGYRIVRGDGETA